MRIATILGGMAIAAGMAFAAAPAQAASGVSPAELAKSYSVAPNIVTDVQYRRRWHGGGGWGRRCAKWRNICGNQYPWGGWRYRRCLRRAGC